MKITLIILSLISISAISNANPKDAITARAVNCGMNDADLERDLTTGDAQAGINGSQSDLDSLVENWIKNGQFGSLAGKTTVVLKPYTVISKIQGKNSLCVIYEGTIVHSQKVSTKALNKETR